MNIQWLIDLFVTYATPMLYIAIALIVMVGITVSLVAISSRRWLLRRPTEWIEIIPPASITKTPEATEQLFSVVHGQYATRSLKNRLLRRLPVMSFEITSTRRGGIRYLVQVEVSQSPMFPKSHYLLCPRR